MKPLNKTANDLFQHLRTRFSPVTIGNENAEVVTDPSEARFFSFDYKENDKSLGTVSVSIIDNRSLKVYFSHDMVESITLSGDWYGFLKELRFFAKQNLLGFDARDIQKDQLDSRDFDFIKQNDGPYKDEDVEITESAMYGSKRKSMQKFENATLVVYHKKTVDEEKRGARSRHIDSIFIESNHERFRFPMNYLNGARAMAVHVSEGGTPYDAVGKHIINTVTEMQNLAKFARMTKHHAMEDTEAESIRNRVVETYHGIKRDIMRMQNPTNYRNFAENFTPTDASGEADVTSLQEKFTRKIWNEKMNDLLPSVQRALEAKIDEAPQPKWKVEIGNKHYTVTARNTMEADRKAKVLAKKDGNNGVGGKIERMADEAPQPKPQPKSQPKWKVEIGNKYYTVTARNTMEADRKAKMLAKKDGNNGVGGKIERMADEVELDKASQPKWKVAIGNKHYTVTARNTMEADRKAKMLAKKDGNNGVGGKIERMAEEVELDELSKKTLGNYVKAAQIDVVGQGMDLEGGNAKAQKAAKRTIGKRYRGVDRAVDRLTKEEVELDEASPSVEKTIKDPNFVLLLKKDDAADRMIRTTKFRKADGLLAFIMSDIASRIIGNGVDAVANFASQMAIDVGEEGESFGTKITPEYKSDKRLATLLAQKYLGDIKKIATDDDYAATVRKDPADVYGKKKKRDGGYHEAVDAFESWAEEVFEATTGTVGTTGTVATGSVAPRTARTNQQVVKALSGGDTTKARNIKRVSDKLARGQKLTPAEMPVAGEIAKSVMTTKKPNAAMQALAQDVHSDTDLNNDEDLVLEKTLKVKAKDDYDGDGKIESPEEEYMGSKDRAIKKSMKRHNEDEFLDDEDSLMSESLALLKKFAGL